MTSREGSLDAPTRHPIAWQDPDFTDPAKLDAEMRRVFDPAKVSVETVWGFVAELAKRGVDLDAPVAPFALNVPRAIATIQTISGTARASGPRRSCR